jgi:plastocyanin
MQQNRPTTRHRSLATRRFAVGAVAIAGLALLGGCGDDDEDDASDDTTETTAGETGDETTTTGDGGSAGAGGVTIVEYAFDPTPVTVAVGETVTWTNDDDFAHTSTSDDDVWDSDEIDNGASFEFTFEEAGTYAYHCAIHNFMEGEVVVE